MVMKKICFLILLCPLLSIAQTNLPAFVNDTLTTSGGYKIYKGQVLYFTNGTADAGYFRFVKFHPNMIKNNTYILQQGSLLVKSLKGYKYAGPDNNSIRITGTASYADGKKEELDILMNFERAISGSDGLPSELNVPEAYKTRIAQPIPAPAAKPATAEEAKKQASVDDIKKMLVADEIKKLFDLYKAGALSKEEYETQKKKLLDRQ